MEWFVEVTGSSGDEAYLKSFGEALDEIAAGAGTYGWQRSRYGTDQLLAHGVITVRAPGPLLVAVAVLDALTWSSRPAVERLTIERKHLTG